MPNEAAIHQFEKIVEIMARAHDTSALWDLTNCFGQEREYALANNVLQHALAAAFDEKPELSQALWIICRQLFSVLSVPVSFYEDNLWALQCALFGYILRYEDLSFIAKDPIPFFRIALNKYVDWGIFQTPESLERLIVLARNLRALPDIQAEIDALEGKIQQATKNFIEALEPTDTEKLEDLEKFLHSLYQNSSCWRWFDFNKTLFWYAIEQVCAKYSQPIQYEEHPEVIYKLTDIAALAHVPGPIAPKELKQFEANLQTAVINNIENLSSEETGRLNPFKAFLQKLRASANILSFQRQLFAAIVNRVKQLSTRDKDIGERLGIQDYGASFSVQVSMLFRTQPKQNGLAVPVVQNGNGRISGLRHVDV